MINCGVEGSSVNQLALYLYCIKFRSFSYLWNFSFTCTFLHTEKTPAWAKQRIYDFCKKLESPMHLTNLCTANLSEKFVCFIIVYILFCLEIHFRVFLYLLHVMYIRKYDAGFFCLDLFLISSTASFLCWFSICDI